MKVLTKVVIIQNQNFVLIETKLNNGNIAYGTISYKDIDSNGKLTRTINGVDMMLSSSPAMAIELRAKAIRIERLYNELVKTGINKDIALTMAVRKIYKF